MIEAVGEVAKQYQLYLGDCLEVMRDIPDGSVDCVVTDPPYGLGFPYNSYEDTRDNLRGLIAGFMPEALRIARRRMLVFCGQTQIQLYPEPNWIVAVTWNTTHSYGRCGFAQWTPLLVYGRDVQGIGSVNGVLKSDVVPVGGGSDTKSNRTNDELQHPCPKPPIMIRKVLNRFVESHSSILDPLCGIGTIGVEAVKAEHSFIGIEIDPKYYAIAERRIADAAAQGRLF